MQLVLLCIVNDDSGVYSFSCLCLVSVTVSGVVSCLVSHLSPSPEWLG